MRIKNLLFVGLFFVLAQTFAQNDLHIADTIDKQFTNILETSNNFQGHKVVKTYKITDLQKFTRTQIGELEERISGLNEEIKNQNEELDRNKKELNDLEAELNHVNQTKDELSLLGMSISKGAYQKIMIGIIIVLILILVVLVYRFRNSKVITQTARKNLDDTEREFEEYRQKALETQQRLGRELQDERNRNSSFKS